MLLYVVNLVLFNGKKKETSSMASMLLVALSTTAYGAGLVWFIRNNLKMLLLTHWEFTMAYLGIFGVTGLLLTWLVRTNDRSKHLLVVFVKWLIRFAGVIAIYNSSASPWGSLVLLCFSAVIYVIYAFNKWVLSRLLKRKAKKQD